MSWRNKALQISRFGRLAFAFGLAGLCAGCFQPLYGSNSAVGGSDVKDQLGAVQVMEVEAPNGTAIARLGVEVRSQLIFDFGQGPGQSHQS